MSPVGLNIVGVGRCRVAPPPASPAERKARRLMSDAAVLAVYASRDAVEQAGWDQRAEVGQFVGVGPSGGSMETLDKLVRASDEGGFSERRFAEHGLRAAHPLLAFQLMNNFSMCHAAIDLGLGGPNRALYSTGAGTVFALVQAVLSGADPFLVGGTDCPTHPIALRSAEPGDWRDGAAMLAVERGGSGPSLIEARFCGRATALPRFDAPWIGLGGGHPVPPGWVDLDARFGQCPAAGAALGWTAALEALSEHPTATAVYWDDQGQLGWARFARRGP